MSKKGGWHKREKRAGVVGAEIARFRAKSRRTRIAREVTRDIGGFENARCECAHKDRLLVDAYLATRTLLLTGLACAPRNHRSVSFSPLPQQPPLKPVV